MSFTKVFASIPSNRVPKKIHIADVKVGDVVLRETDGVAVTVCSKDLTRCDFLGTRLFGDSYMLGYKPVTLLELVPAKLGAA